MTNLQTISNSLMLAVIASGAVRSTDQDGEIAVRVMREELKSFLDSASEKYADERALTMTGGHNLAMATLVAECVSRIVKERA